uniref:LIM zinc-binding domain-containing protein n=1 Tax=Trichogramma kaykai TaxID=54128 RepID=A0ABD2WTJ7_9HYME
MPSSQAAASERRSSADRTVPHEPPKLKTALKTPTNQATNPLQFVKVGPCSLYRTAQEQLQKVQKVVKVKPEVKDEAEDWQSNLDNWKSSRRKRQEHIIERVVEVKKLELEEHDRQRRRSGKTLSEMMENRGRKLSLNLYPEDDSNDLSDLGIGTSSGKSSLSGDAHDDNHSVLSDRDSELDKSQSDVDNASADNGTSLAFTTSSTLTSNNKSSKQDTLNNGFHHKAQQQQEYDSATTATASSPEPDDYDNVRSYSNPPSNASRPSFSGPSRRSSNISKISDSFIKSPPPPPKTPTEIAGNAQIVKVDINKRREIFEKANSTESNGGKNNLGKVELTTTKSIKERLSILERQKSNNETSEATVKNTRHSVDSVKDRYNWDKLALNKEDIKSRGLLAEELESVKPLKERLQTLEKFAGSGDQHSTPAAQLNGDYSAKSIKERLSSLDNGRQDADSKKTNTVFHEQQPQIRAENSTPSERSSSPDSEYRAPRATFHQSLDSLDADASSGPDTFERVQSLEELDPYHHPTSRRYPTSNSSTEILLNDADREDSGILTADISCCTSQAEEAIENNRHQKQQIIAEEKTEYQNVTNNIEKLTVEPENSEINASHNIEQAVLDVMGIVENTSTSSLSCSAGNAMVCTNANEAPQSDLYSSTSRPVVYQSPRVPFRQTPPDYPPPPKPSYLPGLISACSSEPKDSESPSDSSSTNTVCSLNDSQQQLPQQVQQLVRPLPSPRSPSKIPTPLPRKSLSNGSSPSSPARSLPPSPVKPRVLPLSLHKTSEIPVPISPTSPISPRRALVEVIGEEKVVVEEPAHPSYTQGEPQQQQLQRPLQQDNEKINEELAAVEQQEMEKVEVEKEEAEALELALEPEQQQPQVYQHELLKEQDENLIDLNLEPGQGEKVESLTKQVDEIKLNAPVAPIPAVRPTTLALDKTMSFCPDFLSPMSPSGKQILPLSFSSDEEIVTGMAFPMGPPTSGEPPKEKPPPPPVDLSDEDNQPIEPLKRLNSTRRIKKEIRSRRSDFLGIESFNDDDLERELTLTKPPPDMASILAEERRIEQLHRRSYDTDSYYEQDSSHERDSGVELGQAEDWTKQPVSPDMSQHSRQSSEPFGATSVTSSEEDEISKKEREIMEVLEREEQWRYENNRERSAGDDSSDLGEKLAHKLRELEEEKMQLERERAGIINHQPQQQQQHEISEKQQQQQLLQAQQRRQRQQEPNPETLRMNEENLRKQEKMESQHHNSIEEMKKEEVRLLTEQHQISHNEPEDNRLGKQEIDVNMQENNKPMSPVSSHEDESFSSHQEVLRVERELLQLEQEELKRQRNNLAYREQQQQHLADQLHEQWKSMQQENQQQQSAVQTRNHYNSNKSHAVSAVAATTVNYRASMPNLQMHDHHAPVMGPRRRPPPPPPIPPAKPLRLVDQRQRDVTISIVKIYDTKFDRNSRVPSANSGTRVEAPLRSSCSNNSLAPAQQQQQPQLGQQMSRQTLQALSAAPRPRMIQNDQWVQRRKSDVPRGTHDYSNYQHWVIQEAEQRRINEKNQRKPHATGTTAVPYATSVSSMRPADSKPLPDSIIQTLTQRVQSRAVQEKPLSPRRRLEHSASQEHLQSPQHYQIQQTHKQANLNQSPTNSGNPESQEKMLSVSGKKKCSHCGDELGRGAAMIIESLRLFYHMECFKCCVCHVRLGDGLMGTDVRVRNQKLHCHNCYSSDDGTHGCIPY